MRRLKYIFLFINSKRAFLTPCIDSEPPPMVDKHVFHSLSLVTLSACPSKCIDNVKQQGYIEKKQCTKPKTTLKTTKYYQKRHFHRFDNFRIVVQENHDQSQNWGT